MKLYGIIKTNQRFALKFPLPHHVRHFGYTGTGKLLGCKKLRYNNKTFGLIRWIKFNNITRDSQLACLNLLEFDD